MNLPVAPEKSTHITVGEGGEARQIALVHRQGRAADSPMLVWLGGYRSDMSGTKALEMERLAGELGLCGRARHEGLHDALLVELAER